MGMAIVGFLSLNGCKKSLDLSEQPARATSMNDLVVPENFQWEMSQNYTLLVQGMAGEVVEVKTTDGQQLLYKGRIEPGQRELQISLRLPTYMAAVLVGDQKITLGPSIQKISLTSFKSIMGSSNKGLNLDGFDDAVKVGHHPENTPGTDDFTCEAWVNTTVKSPFPWARKIMAKGLDYGIYIDPADGKVRGYINNISTASSATAIDDGNWHHVAFTRSGSTIKIFIDGVEEQSESAGIYSANLNSTADFKIGAMLEGMVTNSQWSGKIDEVRCWKSARTASEIATNRSKKIPGTHPDLQGSWDCDEDVVIPGFIKDRSTHGHHGELENGCGTVPAPIPALDTDEDGVTDVLDDYPTDPLRAFDNYFPAIGEGTLAIEDLWPSKGDYDCNDLVLGYRFRTITNASNKVVEVKATFVVKAVGAHLDNGFAFQLPDAAPSLLSNLTVSGYDLTGGLFTLNGVTHLEAGQTKPVVAVFSNAHKYMAGIANTIPGRPTYPPYTLNITMNVPQNIYAIGDLGLNTWNPFLVINQERGREVHLINRPNTDLANLAYFGTKNDASSLPAMRFYQTATGLPWALDFPAVFNYPVEYTPVNDAYLHFIQWAESGGVALTDWYSNTAPGYRNNALIYNP